MIRDGRLRRALMLSSTPLLTSAALAAASAPAAAQTTGQATRSPAAAPAQPESSGRALSEVVVTARRTVERQQSVPIAVTTVSRERLAEAVVSSVADVERLVPATQIFRDTSGVQKITVRGSFDAFGNDYSVISYIDEVPIDARTLIYALYDLRSVEILKGSQGTLFGRNSTGGAALFTSQRPRLSSFGGYIEGRYGNLDERRVEGALNIPVSETFALRIAGELERRDGTLKSVSVPGLEYGDRNNEALRASALWVPNSTVENYTQATYYREREHEFAQRLISLAGPCTGPTRPAVSCLYQPPFSAILGTGNIRAFFDQQQALPEDQTVNNFPDALNAERRSIQNALTVHLPHDIGIKNISYYGSQIIGESKDYDGTPVRIFDSVHNTAIDTFYTETQVFGKSFGDRLDWRAGFVYSRDDINESYVTAVFPLPVSTTQPRYSPSKQQFTSRAVFGQATYNLSDWLKNVSFTAGFRHTWDDRSLSQQIRTGQPTTVCALQTLPVPATGPVAFPNSDLATCTRRQNLSFDDSNYNLTLDWKPTKNVLVYAATRRGYKAGGFNLLSNDPSLVTYAPETVTDYELGLKADWRVADIPLRTNVSVFKSNYTNIQTSTVRINPANGDINVLTLNQDPVTGQSNEATISGFEIEATIVPTSWLQLSGFYSHLQATYDRFTVPGTTTNLNGADVAGVTPQSYGVTAEARFPLSGPVDGVSLTASYFVRGAPQTNVTSTNIDVADRQSFDARIAFRNVFQSGAELAFYGKNLTDSIACSINTAVSGALTQQCLEPRTYGVQLRYRFGGER